MKKKNRKESFKVGDPNAKASVEPHEAQGREVKEERILSHKSEKEN